MTDDRERLGGARRAFRLPSSHGQLDAQLDDELRFHLEERIEELMAQGMSREDAEAEARRRFGDVDRIGAECQTIDITTERQRSWGERLQAVSRDARLAWRGMVARPGFTVAVVLTLALAIGMNTAIYSAVRSVLLRPLPVEGLDRLVVLNADLLKLDLLGTGLSAGEVQDLSERTELFQAITAVNGGNAFLGGQTEPRRVTIARTMGDFAGVFGVQPHLGRFYDAAASKPGSENVVVLSNALWRELGSDLSIVGQQITLDDRSYDVVGVMPPGFAYPRNTALWRPYPLTERALSPQRRATLNMTPVVRMRDGVTIERVAAALPAELTRWSERFPQSFYGDGSAYRITTTPLVEVMAGQLRPILLVLLGAVVFVLLIACANVASLQLVRTMGRVREVAVRAALGAGRWAIVRQFAIESLLLALLGGVLGVALGAAALRLLARADVGRYEALRTVRLDGPVLALTAGVTVLAGLLFGAVPAWRASRVSAAGVLRDAGRSASHGGARSRFLQLAVVTQVALTLMLLLGSGVMVRSLTALLSTDPGFRGEQVVATQIAPPSNRYQDGQMLALYDRTVARIRALPGVQAAALTSMVPFSDMALDSSPFSIAGAPPAADSAQPHANAMAVTPGYFEAMGVQLLRGRDFSDADRGTPVAIVDDALARQYFPGENPIGRRIDHYGFENVTIIGVARSVDQTQVADEHHPTIYYPYSQLTYPWSAVVVRSTLPTGSVITMVRQALREIDPQLPVYDAQAMPERIAHSLGARRLAVTVLGAFAALALVLAVLGTYGVLSYGTGQRTRELGIRLALGARPGEVVGMVLRGGLLLAGIGLVVGFVGYLGLARLLQAVVFGVSPRDPVTLAVGATVLAAAAVAACWVPARRASRVDPAISLRTE